MNIYLLNATLNGKIFSEVMCDRVSIKGMITLGNGGEDQTNEYYDYSDFCKLKGIEQIRVNKYSLSDEIDRQIIEDLEIDLLIVASWQRLIPEWLINHCKIGAIGAHGSHAGITGGRGRSPQNWALLMGKKNFTFSIFWINGGIDNGDIIDTASFSYTERDTILSSYVRYNLCKANMILDNLSNGRIEKRIGEHQADVGLYLPQRKDEDGKIDWNRDANDIYNFIRALTKPYPGAYTVYQTSKIRIWEGVPINQGDDVYSTFKNGCVLSILGEGMLVKCGKGLLLVTDYTNRDFISERVIFESENYKSQMKRIIDRHFVKYTTPLSPLITETIQK